jgi:hypothetical protein
MTQAQAQTKAPLLRGFLDRCGLSRDAQQNLALAGTSLAAVAFLTVGLSSLSEATADQGDLLAKELAPGGVYHMAQSDLSGSELRSGIAEYARGGEDLSAYFDRPSRKQVKDLPTQEARTAALSGVAQEQVPDFSKTSLPEFAASYHLGAKGAADLAMAKAPGERGVLDTPGMGPDEIAAGIAIGGDLERLRNSVAQAVEASGQPALAGRILISSSKDVASFAANFGEQESKKRTLTGAPDAIEMAQLSLAGVESLYQQRSPVVEAGRDHPSEWENTTAPSIRPVARNSSRSNEGR